MCDASFLSRSFLPGHADDRFFDLAALEQQQRGYRPDAEPRGQLLIVVHIDLGDLDLAELFLGNFVEQRRDHFARAAPFGPKIDQHGCGRFIDLLLEIACRKRHNMWICHGISPIRSQTLDAETGVLDSPESTECDIGQIASHRERQDNGHKGQTSLGATGRNGTDGSGPASRLGTLTGRTSTGHDGGGFGSRSRLVFMLQFDRTDEEPPP